MAAQRTRRIAAAVCGALGVLFIFVAVLLGYARRSVFDERAFSARVAASLEDPRVAGFVAEQLADALIQVKPDLVGLRPILVGLCRSVVASPPFRAAARRSARTLHHAITTGTARDVVLTVKDVGALLESTLATQPGLAAKIPPRLAAAIGNLQSLPGGERAMRLVRFANRVRAAAIGLLFLGIGLCALSAKLASERRRAIVRIGVSLAILALVLAIIARFGGHLLTLFARPPEVAPVLVGLAGAFLGGLMLWAAVLGFAGLVVAAASASLLERVPLREWGGGVQRWLTGPQPRMRLRLARGGLGAAAGAALLLWPLPSLTVAGWLAGLIVAFAGLREAFVAALHLLPQLEPRRRGERVSGRRLRGGVAMAWVGAVALALVGAAAWWILREPDRPPTTQAVTAFNGSPALGVRRLDEVVFPTTHNSMGGPDVPGWMFPNQSAGLVSQLEDGIRGFLIDVHYGVRIGESVRTEIENEEVAKAKYEATLGAEGLAAALRIRDRLTGEGDAERDVFMCHGFCELGALPLVPVLQEVRDFLIANPGEVLIVVIQDEGVLPQDIERCFHESGLSDFVFRGAAGPPWPTLRELVATDERVLVLTENVSTGVDWIHPAFEVLQETPYGFREPSEFSNRPNRGGASGSLRLMNHWIESSPMPKPSNAKIVNARDILLERIRAFRRERGRLPNLVAVDFYREGDLMAVVRELNAEPVPPGRGRKRRS